MQKENKKEEINLEELQKEIKDLKLALNDSVNKNKYLLADFENYKKQQEKQYCKAIENANEKLLLQILNIVDDFERCIVNLDEKDKGVIMIYKNLMKVLEENNVKKIDCVGKEFDHNFAEVLLQEESKEKDNIVLEELQKGYLYNNKVLRYAKVKVSKYVNTKIKTI